MTQTEPVAVWEVPHPDTLTMAELDEVLSLTGVDVSNAGINVAGRVMAALVTWVRTRNGETVSIDDVYRTLRGNQVKVTALDPKR